MPPYRPKVPTIAGRTYRINQYIRAPQVRLIGPDSKQIGVVSREEALKQAQEAQMDLIEIAGNAEPPVVRIAEFNKFKYQEEKKLQAGAKKSKGGQMKEIRLTPFIAVGDLQTRIARIEEFLQERHKVRLTVKFTGRQMNYQQFGRDVLMKIIQHFGPKIKVEGEPKMIGRQMLMTISPA